MNYMVAFDSHLAPRAHNLPSRYTSPPTKRVYPISPQESTISCQACIALSTRAFSD